MTIEVTQADRIASWPHAPDCFHAGDKAAWLAGVHDKQPVIQAFAAHRQAARIEGARLAIEAAKAAWLCGGDVRTLDPAKLVGDAT